MGGHRPLAAAAPVRIPYGPSKRAPHTAGLSVGGRLPGGESSIGALLDGESMNTTTATEQRATLSHPATMPLTLHEREIAEQLLGRGWSIATTARALKRHRELIDC